MSEQQETRKMTTAAKKPKLSLVQPDTAEMERVLTEFAAQQAPMLKRTGIAREAIGAKIKELEAEREAVVARQTLSTRHYEALTEGFQRELGDIDGALALFQGGINGSVVRAAE